MKSSILNNIFIKTIFIITFYITSICSYSNNNIDTEILNLIKQYKLENAKIGISVQNTQDKNYIYQNKNASSLFTPASNNKLLTAIAAMIVLPKNFTFNTKAEINQDTKINNNILDGNLYIKFDGDPTLLSSNFIFLLNDLYKKGIYNINGDIYLLSDGYEQPFYPQGWSKLDELYCYAAPISSVYIDKNCARLLVKNESGDISLSWTNTNAISLKTNIHSGTGSSCVFSAKMDNNDILSLDGCVKEGTNTIFKFAIQNPNLATIDELKFLLKKSNIKLNGQVIISNNIDSSNLKVISNLESQNLDDLLKAMLVYSDNFYAESFARKVGYYLDKNGTIKSSTEHIIAKDSSSLNINLSDVTMVDGSGLSHDDKISPNDIVNLLTYAFNSPLIGTRIYNELAVSGVSGTLLHRMNTELKGKVHAKTGTLDGVVSLSGFVESKKSTPLTFSILINDLTALQRTQGRDFQDKIVKVFYENL